MKNLQDEIKNYLLKKINKSSYISKHTNTKMFFVEGLNVEVTFIDNRIVILNEYGYHTSINHYSLGDIEMMIKQPIKLYEISGLYNDNQSIFHTEYVYANNKSEAKSKSNFYIIRKIKLFKIILE